MTAVLAIDPGECTGVAWCVGSEVVACGAIGPGDELAKVVSEPVPASVANVNWSKARCLVEIPKYYGAKAYGHPSKATAIANSLIREAITLGGFAQQARDLGMAVTEILPRTWKGTLNKKAMCKRIVSKLTKAERQIVVAAIKAQKIPKSKVHNVLDAIGIFLWSVGRL